MKDYRQSRLSPLIFSSAATAVTPFTAQADLTDSVSKMVSEGKATVGLRYRIEDVEQDNALQNAAASTLRTRLTFQTATANRFSALLEADNVTTLGGR
jgi:hypothetical protein